MEMFEGLVLRNSNPNRFKLYIYYRLTPRALEGGLIATSKGDLVDLGRLGTRNEGNKKWYWARQKTHNWALCKG